MSVSPKWGPFQSASSDSKVWPRRGRQENGTAQRESLVPRQRGMEGVRADIQLNVFQAPGGQRLCQPEVVSLCRQSSRPVTLLTLETLTLGVSPVDRHNPTPASGLSVGSGVCSSFHSPCAGFL